MESTDSHELKLRAHIRGLLLDYALLYLATNYVDWTQETTSELLSECLSYVPMVEPTVVALPVEPLEYLSRRWGLEKLDLYEERMKAPVEVLQYLRRQLQPVVRQSGKAEEEWTSPVDDAYETFMLHRPLSPILSAQSRRATPRPGQGIYAASVPQDTARLLKSYKVEKAQGVHIPEQLIAVDDVLGNKLAMDMETHRGVLELFQSIPNMASGSTREGSFEPYEEFLRSSSPPIVFPEPEMLPVFPCNQRPGRRRPKHENKQGSFSAALTEAIKIPDPWLRPVDVKEDEDDFANESLVVVDGWHAFQAPSSPTTSRTPSLSGSSSDIDELFMPSPTIPYMDEDLLPMEEYQLPRAEKLGSSRPKVSEPEGNSLSAFLSPLLHTPRTSGPRIIRSPKSQPSSPHTAITMSMLGQPPSTVVGPSVSAGRRYTEDELSSDDTITVTIKAVEKACGNVARDKDPASLVLDEKLDGKDSLLMDVPVMPLPNEHNRKTHEAILPTRLTDLLAPAQHKERRLSDQIQAPHKGFLRKVKGVQPLRIELSWIPFKYGRTVPTDEEAADVVNDPCPQLAKAIDLTQQEIVSRLAMLLDDSKAFSSQPLAASAAPSTLSCSEDDSSDYWNDSTPLTMQTTGLVLPRADRRRLAGLNALSTTEDEDDNGSSDKENEVTEPQFTADTSDIVDRLPKRARLEGGEDHAGTEGNEDALDYLTTNGPDDSGVFFTDIADGDEHSSFMQLAFDAEGFEGPPDDGDVFFDVHPIHFGDYRFDGSPRPDTISRQLGNQLTGGNGSPLRSTAYATGFEEDPLSLSAVQPCPDLTMHTCPPVFEEHLPGHLSGRQPFPDTDLGMNLAEEPELLSVSSSQAKVPGNFSARLSLAQYLTICGKGSLVEPTANAAKGLVFDQPLESMPASYTVSSVVLRDAPLELLDERTMVLPDTYEPSEGTHRYIASMDLIQKRALVRALSAYCSVEIVDREHLGAEDNPQDVHLILDCDTAVLFYALEMLPSSGDALVELLSQLSWRYSSILVVFECYPTSWDYRGDRDFSDKPVASAWSPPVVKAAGKLRRDLSIAEGMQTKRAISVVQYAFANTVQEAAACARVYGDLAKSKNNTDSRDVVWGERSWLTHEERDGEYDLCRVDGMNLFAAALLLSHTTLEDFLEKPAEERLLEFGELAGEDRIARFNVEMARRLDAMRLPPSSPINADASSSLNSVPYIGDSEMDLY